MEKLSKFQKLILILGFISTTGITYSTYMIHKASCIDFAMGLYSFRISSDIGNIEGVLEDIKTEISTLDLEVPKTEYTQTEVDLDYVEKRLDSIDDMMVDVKYNLQLIEINTRR